MVAAVIEISCVCFSRPLEQRVAVVPPTEVNVGDIPAVKQEYVRSLTGTIQIGDSAGLTDSVIRHFVFVNSPIRFYRRPKRPPIHSPGRPPSGRRARSVPPPAPAATGVAGGPARRRP